MWKTTDIITGINNPMPMCVSSAQKACQEEDPRKRPSLRALLGDAEWQQVANERTRYMSWEAENRLRRTSWYAYRVNFRNGVEPEYQWLTFLLRSQIQERGRGQGHIADAEWSVAAEP